MIDSLGRNTCAKFQGKSLQLQVPQRPFISTNTAIHIYNALIVSQYDCCSHVWGSLSGQLSDKLQNIQNRPARVITKSSFKTSSNLLLNELRLERLLLVAQTKNLWLCKRQCINLPRKTYAERNIV